jgi:hypothetical protein
MALPADIQPRMNEWDPAHYRLFGIRTVAAPAGIRTALPPFWTRDETIGRFDLFSTPDAGYFDVVDAPFAVSTTKHTFYDINDRWLQSDWVAKHQHLVLDLAGFVPPLPRLTPDQSLPPAPSSPAAGEVFSEREGETFDAEVGVARPALVLFKMTWHANWRAKVDGTTVSTAMLSPGFIGVPVTAGKHHVSLRYEGSAWKIWLALAGILAVAAMSIVLRRSGLEAESKTADLQSSSKRLKT